MGKALEAIENVYEMALNPEQDILAQLQQILGPSGEMGSHLASNKLLFALCKIVDTLEERIRVLEDDRVAIANKMLELEGKKPEADAKTTDTTKPDPTQPLQS